MGQREKLIQANLWGALQKPGIWGNPLRCRKDFRDCRQGLILPPIPSCTMHKHQLPVGKSLRDGKLSQPTPEQEFNLEIVFLPLAVDVPAQIPVRVGRCPNPNYLATRSFTSIGIVAQVLRLIVVKACSCTMPSINILWVKRTSFAAMMNPR